MQIKDIFSANCWISVVVILALIKNSLFVLLNFADFGIERIFYMTFAASILLSFITLLFDKRQSQKRGVIITCLITFLVIFGCYLSIAHKFVKESFWQLFIFMLIPFNLIQYIKKPYNFSYLIYISIFALYVLGLSISYLFKMMGLGYGADGMLVSYAISIPSAALLYFAFMSRDNTKIIIFLVLAIWGVYLTFQGGSRGSLIPIFFALVLGLVQRKINMKLVWLFGFILVLLYLNVEFITGLLDESRSFTLLTGGSITQSDDRNSETWGPTINAIFESPLWGWGCFSDRTFTVGEQWAHNIFLEVASNYGLVLGIIFTIFIVRFTGKWCLKRDNKVLTTLFLISMPQLLVSNSYLLSIYFWIFFGFIIFWTQNSKYFKYNNDDMSLY